MVWSFDDETNQIKTNNLLNVFYFIFPIWGFYFHLELKFNSFPSWIEIKLLSKVKDMLKIKIFSGLTHPYLLNACISNDKSKIRLQYHLFHQPYQTLYISILIHLSLFIQTTNNKTATTQKDMHKEYSYLHPSVYSSSPSS